MRSWKEQKNKLCNLIKMISDHYGGDDLDFLRSYCAEVINTYKDDLKTALQCFEDIAKIAGINTSVVRLKIPFNSNVCCLCKYMPTFCFCKKESASETKKELATKW